jgi:hypothetical protein
LVGSFGGTSTWPTCLSNHHRGEGEFEGHQYGSKILGTQVTCKSIEYPSDLEVHNFIGRMLIEETRKMVGHILPKYELLNYEKGV